MTREPHRYRTAQRLHAMRRFLERYGVQLSQDDFRAISDRVFRFTGAGDGRGVIRANGHDLFFVSVGGRWVIAAWDEASLQISTFLPLSLPVTPRVGLGA